MVNQHLLRDLTELGLWNEDIKNAIIANNGSIQNIEVGFSCILGMGGGQYLQIRYNIDILLGTIPAEVGKITLKSNGAEALSDEFLLKVTAMKR